MLWYLPWSENIKKRACRYLLQRYLGNFLEEKLTLDQLSVDLYNGTGSVCDVSLDCEALNVLGDQQNWPLGIVDGYMKEITVTIPWSTILKDDSIVEVNGLSLTVQPKVRPEPVSSMLESMWSSTSSSMQMAAECLREEEGPQEANPVEGIEMFAHAIDSILSRVKVKFVNTKIRIEHVPKNSDKGIALEIHIKHIDFYDEAGSEPPPEVTDPDKPKTYIVSTSTNKRILFDGVTLHTDEFPSKYRTMARSLLIERSVSSQPEKNLETSELESQSNYTSTMSDVFYETKSVILSTPDTELKDSIIKEVLETTNENLIRRDVSPEERANLLDPILFAKLTGRQELVLKLKYSEEVVGPKVDLQLTMGSLIVFLSPRQLNTLLELGDGLSQPHLEDNSNLPLRPSNVNMQCKPMRQADFQLIEAQLMGNFNKEASRPNLAMFGWTGQSFEDSVSESSRFQPMADAGLGDSFCSSVSSVSCSAVSSVQLPTRSRTHRNTKVPQIDGDPTAEVSHINIKIASCSCILLHKDILVPITLGTDCVTPASVKAMHEASTSFFEELGFFSVSGHGRNDFREANDMLNKATKGSHLRLIASSLIMDGSEKTSSHGRQTNCEATISRVLLRECFYTGSDSPEAFDLLKFDTKEVEDNDDDTASTAAGQPAVRINYKQTLKYMRVGGERKLLYPTTDITIICLPLRVDIDLTVLERMSWCGGGGEASGTQNHCNLALHIADLDAVLRFPIVDFRPGINRDSRRVRADYLLIKLADVLVNCQQVASIKPLATTITTSASDIDLYYYENDTSNGIHIAKANVDATCDTNRDILKEAAPALPMITLTFQPKKSPSGLFDPLSDDEAGFEPPAANPMTTSMYIMDKIRDNSNPSPFSSKKTAHQTTTKHQDSPQVEVEELVVAGNEEEMSEFTSHCVEQSSIHLALNFPVLSLQLESKQLYELVYNRINCDLLLWEPRPAELDVSAPQPSIYPTFTMCHTPGYDSESASSSSEEDNIFYSTYEQKVKQKKIAAKPASDSKLPHNFCLTIKLDKGLLTIYTPVRDSNKRVVPGQMGELVLDAHKLSLCTASGLRQRPKTAQLCLRVAKTTLYHDAVQTIPDTKPPLRTYGSPLPPHLKETIYPSGPGVRLKTDAGGHMLTMALNVEPHPHHANFKKICLALGIDGGTLRHRGATGISWLTQLLDVLDVIDYPVPGYRPSIVVTELHATVSNCAVDYRPLNLPIRSIITLGSFSVSSNLIAQTNTSSLRFLLQEAALFVAHCPDSPDHPAGLRPDLNNYVCVCDVPLFQLSLRTPAEGTSSGPQVDLSASNNSVNIRTCWDSASALCRLLVHVTRAGDTTTDQPSPPIDFDEQPEEIRELSPSEIQQVNDLMAEALKESPNTTLDDEEINTSSEKEGVEIFFFPDESNVKKLRTLSLDTEETPDENSMEYHEALSDNTEDDKMNAQVAKELGDPNSPAKVTPKKPERVKTKSSGSGNNTDEEYCIIESATSCEDDELSEPTVKWYGDEPAPIIDNHFTVPVAKSDVLKAPDSFPPPVTRYTLCEMSIQWQMFGGNDFKQPEDSTTPTKRVTIDAGRSPQSPRSPKCTIDYEPYQSRRSSRVSYRAAGSSTTSSARQNTRRDSLLQRGGPGRDVDTQVQLLLSKVKFQHETYPSGSVHASRQTLAISKIEVLDRLANSHINKLLSQYLMNDEPERKNAHMLVIKAVQMRGAPGVPAQECCLKVSLLPLRLNVDQDTLAFLVGFFSKLGSDEQPESASSSSPGSLDSGSSRQTTPTHRPPVMSVTRPAHTSDNVSINEDEPLMETYEAERLVSENLIQLEEEFQLGGSRSRTISQQTPDPEPSDQEPLYFRRVVFSPEVPIRLDYVGKRVDLSAGPIAGLLMGLGQLNCSELKLKRLYHRQGVLGVERLVRWALREWLSDMKRHQLPGLLGGIGPMHSLLQFVRGMVDLVWLPVEQWRRDGRVVHGLRRGAASFTCRTALAALDLAATLAAALQTLAETAFDMLSPAAPLPLPAPRRRRRRQPPAQHADLREGVAAACTRLREGFAETAASMSRAARGGSGGGVLRQLPGAAVAPLALAAGGAADVLGGVRASLAPTHTRDTRDKWRQHTESPTSD